MSKRIFVCDTMTVEASLEQRDSKKEMREAVIHTAHETVHFKTLFEPNLCYSYVIPVKKIKNAQEKSTFLDLLRKNAFEDRVNEALIDGAELTANNGISRKKDDKDHKILQLFYFGRKEAGASLIILSSPWSEHYNQGGLKKAKENTESLIPILLENIKKDIEPFGMGIDSELLSDREALDALVASVEAKEEGLVFAERLC